MRTVEVVKNYSLDFLLIPSPILLLFSVRLQSTAAALLETVPNPAVQILVDLMQDRTENDSSFDSNKRFAPFKGM